MNPEVVLKIDALDNTKAAFSSVKNNLSGLEKSTSSFKDAVENLQPTFKKMAVGGGAALAAMATGLTLSVREARNAEAAQFRLSQILRTATGASDEQVAALNAQAEALEKVGVISGESITQAQAQLATFDLQAETISQLTPAILDYVVAEKGATASTEDLKQLTNGLAQALNGNFGSLTRVGFVLDDVTKELIANGTESERAAALVSVLNSTYEGMNEAARGTAEGGMVALQNETGRLAETIGQQVLPMVTRLTEVMLPIITRVIEWTQANPELTQKLIIATAAIAGVVAVVGTLGLLLPPIIGGFALLAAGIGALSLPIIAITALLGVIGVTMFKLWKNWDESWTSIKWAASNAWEWIREKAIDPMIQGFEKVLRFIERVRDGLKSIGAKVGSSVSSAGSSISRLLGSVTPFADGGIVTKPTLGLVGEAGPEAIIPLTKAGALGGGGITINIAGTFMDDRAAARRMGDEIMNTLKQQMRL